VSDEGGVGGGVWLEVGVEPVALCPRDEVQPVEGGVADHDRIRTQSCREVQRLEQVEPLP
jgi:hypothetical protein